MSHNVVSPNPFASSYLFVPRKRLSEIQTPPREGGAESSECTPNPTPSIISTAASDSPKSCFEWCNVPLSVTPDQQQFAGNAAKELKELEESTRSTKLKVMDKDYYEKKEKILWGEVKETVTSAVKELLESKFNGQDLLNKYKDIINISCAYAFSSIIGLSDKEASPLLLKASALCHLAHWILNDLTDPCKNQNEAITSFFVNQFNSVVEKPKQKIEDILKEAPEDLQTKKKHYFEIALNLLETSLNLIEQDMPDLDKSLFEIKLKEAISSVQKKVKLEATCKDLDEYKKNREKTAGCVPYMVLNCLRDVNAIPSRKLSAHSDESMTMNSTKASTSDLDSPRNDSKVREFMQFYYENQGTIDEIFYDMNYLTGVVNDLFSIVRDDPEPNHQNTANFVYIALLNDLKLNPSEDVKDKLITILKDNEVLTSKLEEKIIPEKNKLIKELISKLDSNFKALNDQSSQFTQIFVQILVQNVIRELFAANSYYPAGGERHAKELKFLQDAKLLEIVPPNEILTPPS